MAFESFPSDSFRAYEDPGIYYVNEKGNLRSAPGMGRKSNEIDEDWLTLGLSPPGIINGIFLSNRHRTVSKVTCYDGTEQNVYNPKKLFDISLMFVADNINLVDSLIGFPDIVGEQLFNTAMELRKFDNYNTAVIGLRLFYEAYGGAVLETLSLRDRHVALTNRLDCVVIFTGLSALDLGGCGIGNDEDVLGVIGNMYCLQELCLCSNRLSDDGLQKMTTPLRMLGRGAKKLKALDLSENLHITNLGVKFLTAYKSLQRLDLSGCSVSTQGITTIQRKLPTLRAADSDEKKQRFPITIGNRGWAVPLVQRWLSVTPDAGRHTKLPSETKTKAMTFYGQKLAVPPPLFTEVKTSQSVIQLIADDNICPTKQIADDKDACKQPSKRFKSECSKTAARHKTDTNCDTKGCDFPEATLGTMKLNKIKIGHRNRNRNTSKGSRPSTDCVTRSKERSRGQKKVGVSEEDEQDNDLMQSYLQARDRDGASSQSSLWDAMQSQKW